MAYSQKSKSNLKDIAKHTRLCHAYLELEATEVYGSPYSQLNAKEKEEISLNVAKKYKLSLKGD
jgi:hypothetical protein